MKSKRMIAVIAALAALMMLLTPLVPVVADADDGYDLQSIEVDADNGNVTDIEDEDLSVLLMEILGSTDDVDFADGQGIFDLLDGGVFDELFNDGGAGTGAKEDKEISETEIVDSKYSLSNGSKYTFKGDGCLVFKSGSVLETDLNFILTGVGKTTIVLEEGSIISFLGNDSEVVSDVTVVLNGTFAVKLELPNLLDIILGGLTIEASANLSDNGAMNINGAEIVGNGNNLISVTANVKLSDTVMAAITGSDFESLKKALFDANDNSVFDAKASMDIEKITYGEMTLKDVSGELKAGFVKTDSDTGDCIVVSGKLSAKAVDKSDNVSSLDAKGSVGITKGDFSKFLDSIADMDVSKDDMPTYLPKMHVSSEATLDSKFIAEDGTGSVTTLDVKNAKMSFEAIVGMAGYEVETTGKLLVNVDSVSVDAAGSVESPDVDASLNGVSATIDIDGNLTLAKNDPMALLSLIKDGSNVRIDSAKFNIEDLEDTYSIAVENINAELTSVENEAVISVTVGSIALFDDVEAGSREYMKIDGSEARIDLTKSGELSDLRMKNMSVEIKMIGLDPQKIVFENVRLSAGDGAINIDEGVATFENCDIILPSGAFVVGEKAALKSTNSVFNAIELSKGASFNGDFYIRCVDDGRNGIKSTDNGVNIVLDEDCSDFRLRYSTDSAGNFEIKIVPNTGYELPEWKTGLKYDENGILTEFDGTLSVSCEPKEYELTVGGVVDGKYRYGAIVTLDETWSGSEIIGWKDGTGVIYPAGSDYRMPARDVILSPANSITVTSPIIEEDKIVAESDESSLIVPSSTLEVIKGDLATKQLELAVGDATLLIDKSIADGIDGDLYFGVEVKTIFDSTAVANVVGDNTVYSIRLSGDNGDIHSFPGQGTTVEFSTVYELKEGETPSTIILVFLSEDGRMEETKTTVVDKGDGTVLITSSLPHLSDYMVTVKSTGEGNNGMSMDAMMLVVIIAAIVIAIAATAFFLLKRKQ